MLLLLVMISVPSRARTPANDCGPVGPPSAGLLSSLSFAWGSLSNNSELRTLSFADKASLSFSLLDRSYTEVGSCANVRLYRFAKTLSVCLQLVYAPVLRECVQIAGNSPLAGTA